MDHLSCTQYFTLQDRIDGSQNLWSCLLCYADSDIRIDTTAIEYGSFEEAKTVFKSLNKLNSPYIAKPRGFCKFENKGMVIVERLRPFSNWLDDKGKHAMWNVFGVKRTCIGLGEGFKKKFRQIMFGLREIHKLHLRHGNLQNGVYLGTDGNIRLANFMISKVDITSLKKDYEQFIYLVELAVSKHKKPAVARERVGFSEVKQLKDLFEEVMSSSSFNEHQAFLLYGSPILWSSFDKSLFFNALCSAIKADPYLSTFFEDRLEGWSNRIIRSSPLYDTLHFQAPHRCFWYDKKVGLVVLIRNFLAHHYILVDPFNEVELLFPGIAGDVYHDLATKQCHRVVLSFPRAPPKYQKHQTEIAVGRASFQSTNILTSKFFFNYLDEETTMWKNYR